MEATSVLVIGLLLVSGAVVVGVPEVRASVFSVITNSIPPCEDAPYNTNCICNVGEQKLVEPRPIPILPQKFYCTSEPAIEEPELFWFIQQYNEVGGNSQECVSSEKGNPFEEIYRAQGNYFETNEECLNAVLDRMNDGCAFTLITTNGIEKIVMSPIGTKLVCNEDRHWHICTENGWVIDIDSAVITTGQSYCPAT
jgi:hypothetical protein